MQLVIEISDGLYNNLGTIKNGSIASKIILDCVRKGTPLPKGHGRLIDADALPLHAIDDANYGSNYIQIAPTIIEADKN
jgi:hypothetical protein